MNWKIFFSALTIRWIYALILFAGMGQLGLKGVDSITYAEVAHQFAEAVATGSVHGWDWLGPNTVIMPLYNVILSLFYLLFGNFGPIAYVLAQGVLDSATCILVFLTAQSIKPVSAAAAAIAAIVNPTQIVMSGLIYPDTPFVFFVALSFYGAIRWLQFPSTRNATLIAIGLSCGALIRALLLPWAAVLLVLLFCVATMRSRLSIRLTGQIAGIAAVLLLCIGAVVARNVAKYDAWALTSQGGMHLQTVVPWVRRAFDGTPWTQGYRELVELTDHRFPKPTQNPFEASRRDSQIAVEEWRTFGIMPTLKAWIYGAVINLGSPGIILSPPLIQIPRTGFYETRGPTMAEKMKNFLFHSESATYGWALLVGIAGVFVIRIIQTAGLIDAIEQAWRERTHMLPIATLFALWFCFILTVNGPVASPKYRLPLEPVLNILTGIGFYKFRQWG